MADFKPDIDGQDLNNQNGDAKNEPKYVQISEDDWNQMKSRLDAFERNQGNYNAQPATPPPVPQGPSLKDQVDEISGKIEQLDKQIDEYIADGKGVSKLMRERSKLESKSLRLQIQEEDIKPVINAGLNTMSQLTEKVTRSEMPYYDIIRPEVDKQLANLTQEQRANPQVVKLAYQFAVGENFDKIFNARMEKQLREQAAAQSSIDASSQARDKKVTYNETEIPNFESIMSAGALQALKDKGLTPDEYYKRLGYKDGWAEHYSKNKAFYE
jgi:hypothetical protein